MNDRIPLYRCLAVASDLDQFLLGKKTFALTVHSVFNHSVNTLTDGGELLTIASKGRAIMPMGLIIPVDVMAVLGLSPGDRLHYDGAGNIALPDGTAQLSLSGTPVMPVLLNGFQQANAPSLDAIRQALTQHESTGISSLIALMDEGDGGGNEPPLSIYSAYIARDVDLFLEAWGNMDFEAAFERTKRLIGFGPGLTPSCDDFLSGILLWSFYDKTLQGNVSFRKFANGLVDLAKERTTLVSYHMLRHAAQGRANAMYLDLVGAMTEDDAAFLEQALERVLSYGASSGADFLLGLYAAAAHALIRRNPFTMIKEKAFVKE